MDKTNPDTWRNIRPGSTFVITDEQTITEAVKARLPNATNGKTMKISEIKRIRQQDNLCSWLLFKAEGNGETLYPLVKIVDSLLDVRLYYPVTWFPEASRQEIIDKGDCFLFSPPPNPNDFQPADLEMAMSFPMTFDDKEIFFNRKGNTFYAETTEVPAQSGIGKVFTHVTEYLATEAHSTPELIFFEFGGVDLSGKTAPAHWQGGWIMFLEGYNINPADIEILPV